MLILLLFFCSGATALVYEVLWSRYLSLILGSSVQAQTVVLAVFMGGLAIGNRVWGKRSASLESPLATYGFLELAIGLYGFFFSRLYQAGDWLFVKTGSPIAEFTLPLFLLKLALSIGLLILPTVLMGGTLPVIAAWIQRQPAFESGARVGIFYAVNSLGAVFGAGMAGFVLIQSLGLVSSLELTGIANFIIGLIAVVLGKREMLDVPEQAAAATASGAEPGAGAGPQVGWFGLLVALTGGVSMGLEVLSARALALIAGGSLQAFALVLMSFILGIGLGSVVISSSRAARAYGVNTIYLLLFAAAGIVILNVIYIEEWTLIYSKAKYGLAANEIGYRWHQAGIALISFLILGLPAAFLGAVVPLSIRLVNAEGVSLGDQVGRVLTCNTIGAVVGVLVTGFVLMPLIGLRGALSTLALLLVCVAGFIAFKRQQIAVMLLAVLIAGGSLTGIASTGEGWQQILGAGVYRVRNTFVTRDWIKYRKEENKILFYKDSADATVSVERAIPESNEAETNQTSQIILRINGKTDASTMGDMATQYLLAHLPMMAQPDAKEVFVLGFGSGITGGALLGHPIERLTIAENCGPVLQAARFFADWNRGVLTNERTRIRKDDARAVLKLSPQKYDVIISEPSNPWVAGIGSVFTREFYELCASRLATNGIMAQWFHKYEMSDDIVFVVLRTFADVFPHMEIWDPQEGDLILLGSFSPWQSSPANYQRLFQMPGPKEDLAKINIKNAVTLWARQIASQSTALAIPGDGPIQTDEFPLLEYAAPQAFFTGQSSHRIYYFDERTVQYTLADSTRIAAMRALPNTVLAESFEYWGTSNPDIRLYLNAIGADPVDGVKRIDPMGQIVFRPPDSYPEMPAHSTNASPEYVTCLTTEAKMLRGDIDWREGAAQIREVLVKLLQDRAPRPRDFSPSYYAAFATRFAIGNKDYRSALDTLRIGLMFDFQDEQLQYLARVLERVTPPELLTDGRAAPQQPE